MPSQSTFLIGIDPDAQKSGVAIKRAGGITLHTLTFFELFARLNEITKECTSDSLLPEPHVHIEAGWLNAKSNFHDYAGQTPGAREKIAKNTGANHETGRKIAELCEFLGIAYTLVKPLRKIWKGPNGKITHVELCGLWKECPRQTNQETRDAVLLIL